MEDQDDKIRSQDTQVIGVRLRRISEDGDWSWLGQPLEQCGAVYGFAVSPEWLQIHTVGGKRQFHRLIFGDL
jgi:hypothetical protein